MMINQFASLPCFATYKGPDWTYCLFFFVSCLFFLSLSFLFYLFFFFFSCVYNCMVMVIIISRVLYLVHGNVDLHFLKQFKASAGRVQTFKMCIPASWFLFNTLLSVRNIPV